jgi:oligopeptide transport system substrate-binding protein
MWRSAGIDVELAAAEAKVHWNLLEVRDFEATYNTWQFDYNDAKNLFFTFQAAAVQMNNSAYDSAAFEDLLKRADAEPDLVARGRLLGEANARLIADLPAVPLMFPYQRHLVKGYVKGWNSNARDVNRSRWLDIGDKPATGDRADGGNNDGDGVFAWLGSWFSGDAWDKWWNS